MKVVLTVLLAALASASPIGLAKRDVTAMGAPYLVDSQNTDGAGMHITFLQDGSLLGGYNGMRGDVNKIVVYHSTDNAASWQGVGDGVLSGDPGSTDIGNSWFSLLPNGQLVVAYRNHERPNGVYSNFKLDMSVSNDNGVTWEYLSTIVQRPADGQNGLWEPALYIANDGTLQCYFSSEKDADDQDNYMVYSRDSGKTWTADWTPVSGLDRASRDGMTGVSRIDDNGNLICVFENTETAHFTVDYVLSHDDGYTWGERTNLYTPAGAPSKTAGAPSIANVWGVMVAMFMTDQFVDKTLTGGYDGGEARVMISRDGANSWEGPFLASDGAAHWAYIHNQAPGQFLTAYSRDGSGMVNQVFQID